MDAPDRRDTWSFKWDRYAPEVLPLWVADMDLPAPPVVIEALRARLDHGVFGYTGTPPEFGQSLASWLSRRHGWTIDPAWVVPLPGTMVGAAAVARALGAGPAIVTPPLYPPLLRTPDLAGGRSVRVPLTPEDGIDWPALEAAAAEARVLWWCSPHNPTGRVWTDAEHAQLEDLVLRHDLTVVSDEIWMDLVLEPGCRHQPLGSRPRLADRVITLTAPSKTFNLPGLGCAAAIIPDAARRRAVLQAGGPLMAHVTLPGLIAAVAAWQSGDAWLDELIPQLRAHRDSAVDVLKSAGFACSSPQSTYLVWFDASRLGADPTAVALARGVGLSDGREFGRPGWLRLNVACGTSVLEEALRRLVCMGNATF